MARNLLAPWRGSSLTPFPFGGLQEQINRLFDDFWRDFPVDGQDFEFSPLQPKIDVVEEDDAWRISAEMPGVDEKDIELKASDGALTLSGEKKIDEERKEKNWQVRERSYGAFRRTFRLPPGADVDKIKAKFDKGVLEITVPKLPEAKQASRRIEIGK